MNSSITIAVIALVGSAVTGFLSFRASVAANKVSEKKVDAEAYERSQHFYERLLSEADKALDRLRTQTERLQDQLERVNSQLAQEQDVSNLLRSHIRALQTQVNTMEAAISNLGHFTGSPGYAGPTREDGDPPPPKPPPVPRPL